LRNLLNKKLKNEKGMTLIELLAVIVILAIIALIAIPAIGNIISNSKSKAILADATTIISGAKTAFADGACKEENKCTGAELKDFVEISGTELDGTKDFVEKTKDTNGKTTYKITYAGLGKLNEKYSKKLGGTESTKVTSATQSKIAEAMGGKEETK